MLMKILFLTNLYPPHYLGGYEQLCMDVVDGLTVRGHDCHVLTSTYGIEGDVSDGRVHRLLELEGGIQGKRSSFLQAHRIRIKNEIVLRKMIRDISPDIVFVWSMRRLSRSLILLAEQLQPGIVYYITDNWLCDQYRPTLRNLKKYVQSYQHLFQYPELKHVICSSEHIKQEMITHGVPLDSAHVIYNGIDLEPYLRIPQRDDSAAFRILFVGRIVPEKGVHTLLQAFIHIASKNHFPSVQLTIVGTGEERYIKELEAMTSRAGLENDIHFTGNVPRDALAGFFATHDIFVFPSIWQEPFSLTLIMALASEIPVIGTLTGGSKEILRHQHNCLAFAPGDCADLTRKIEQLLVDSKLRLSLAEQGRKDSLACSLPAMIASVEEVLVKVASGVKY